mmetsp:Transcript_72587/g.143917  ORF Transcript_72587/g.143917 Transcript_72587/m.143917 type:complete len:216 (-) Transcript_72587:579-1226(-)
MFHRNIQTAHGKHSHVKVVPIPSRSEEEPGHTFPGNLQTYFQHEECEEKHFCLHGIVIWQPVISFEAHRDSIHTNRKSCNCINQVHESVFLLIVIRLCFQAKCLPDAEQRGSVILQSLVFIEVINVNQAAENIQGNDDAFCIIFGINPVMLRPTSVMGLCLEAEVFESPQCPTDSLNVCDIETLQHLDDPIGRQLVQGFVTARRRNTHTREALVL